MYPPHFFIINKMHKPIIILVAPQMGENIGAAARAMKNFAIEELRIVEPRDGWPNEKAMSMAVGAANIVHEAKIFSSLTDAINDLEYVYATTAQPRDMNKQYVNLRQLNNDMPKNAKVGFLFGRESTGLNNEEIALANKIITINTDPSFSSLNIAQAVMLICYEIFNMENQQAHINKQELATKLEVEYFFEHLFSELDKTPFFRNPEKKHHMTLNIRNIFTRIEQLSHNEVQSLRGIITALTRKK
ncbi:MAG: tRNA/rRNA methyltransferase [Rickettsiaceae bacterium]|jgi:tRNA/rRNA methyltransferase|nr:tRNA/rRNA methyltransferase [Rickettsiaceae bacterium]